MKLAAVLVGLSLFAVQVSAQPAAPAASPPRSPAPTRLPPVISPDVMADGRVTFRLRAPEAREVSVAGLSAPLPMTKDEAGLWSATTPTPLPPDIYFYGLTVDGVRVEDPANPKPMWAGSPAGSAGGLSPLSIPGAPWTNETVAHGAVARHAYTSAIIGGPETFYVYTPPGYDPRRKEAYPVMVVLHGLGNSAQDWIVQGGANLTLDTLIADGKAEPMILVSPAAYGNSQGTRAAAAGFDDFTRVLLEEILPRVEAGYNASKDPSQRAITGLSMGGAQSLLMLDHTDKFEWIGGFSPGFDMYHTGWGTSAVGPTVNGQRPALPPGQMEAHFIRLDRMKARLKLLYVACGTADDHLVMTQQFERLMEAHGVKSTYVETPGVGHVWPYWRQQFAAFSTMVFR